MIAVYAAIDITRKGSLINTRIMDRKFNFKGIKDACNWSSDLLLVLLLELPNIMTKLWSFILVLESFVVFLIWNNGIVIGNY